MFGGGSSLWWPGEPNTNTTSPNTENASGVAVLHLTVLIARVEGPMTATTQAQALRGRGALEKPGGHRARLRDRAVARPTTLATNEELTKGTGLFSSGVRPPCTPDSDLASVQAP